MENLEHNSDETGIINSSSSNGNEQTMANMVQLWTPGFMHHTNETTYVYIENPHDMIDPFHSNQNFMTIVLTHAITFIVGVIGNSVVIATWARGGKIRSPTATFLVSLACADLLLLIIFMPLETLEYFVITWDHNGHICKLSSFVELLSGMSSILNLVAVSVERFLVIVYPIHARRWCTVTKSRRSLIFVWLLAIIFAAPPVFNKSTYSMTYYNNETVVTAYYCFEKNDNWAIYFSIYELLTLFIIPALLMIFCYSRVIRELWTSTRVVTILTSATNGYHTAAAAVSSSSHAPMIRTNLVPNKADPSSFSGNRSYLVRWSTKKMVSISVNCEPTSNISMSNISSSSSGSRVIITPVPKPNNTSFVEDSTRSIITPLPKQPLQNVDPSMMNTPSLSICNSVVKIFALLPNIILRVLPSWPWCCSENKKCSSGSACLAQSSSSSTSASIETKHTRQWSSANNHQNHHRCHPSFLTSNKCSNRQNRSTMAHYRKNCHVQGQDCDNRRSKCKKCLTMMTTIIMEPESSISDQNSCPSVAKELNSVGSISVNDTTKPESTDIWYRKVYDWFCCWANHEEKHVQKNSSCRYVLASPTSMAKHTNQCLSFEVQTKPLSTTISLPTSASVPINPLNYKTPAVTDVRNTRRQLYCQVIKMLLFIVILFHICWGPRLVFNVIKSTGLGQFDKFAYSARVYFYLLSFIHSALNPFVYGFMSSNFRRMMMNSCNHHYRHQHRKHCGTMTPVNNSLAEAMATTSCLNMDRGHKASLSTENSHYNSVQQRNSSISDSYCEPISMTMQTPSTVMSRRTNRQLSSTSADMIVMTKHSSKHHPDEINVREEASYNEIENEINQMVDSIQRHLHTPNAITSNMKYSTRLKKFLTQNVGASKQDKKLCRTLSLLSLKRYNFKKSKNGIDKISDQQNKYTRKQMKRIKKTRNSCHSLTSYSKHSIDHNCGDNSEHSF